MFQPVTHVIFDLDGLILDTESIYTKITEEIALRYGKEYTDEIKLKIRGTPGKIAAETAVRKIDLPLSPEEFLKIYRPMCDERFQHPNLKPGVSKLILHLKKHNIPLAIATSCSQHSFLIKTKNYPDLFSCFHHVVYGSSDSEVKNGKPHPDIFLICASRFPDSPYPKNCLVLEDAPNGVNAALQAGMQVVMVPAADVSEELRKPATLVLKTLEDFRPELFGLPAYDS